MSPSPNPSPNPGRGEFAEALAHVNHTFGNAADVWNRLPSPNVGEGVGGGGFLFYVPGVAAGVAPLGTPPVGAVAGTSVMSWLPTVTSCAWASFVST